MVRRSRRSCASPRGEPSYANHVQSNLRQTDLRPEAVTSTIVWSGFFPVAHVRACLTISSRGRRDRVSHPDQVVCSQREGEDPPSIVKCSSEVSPRSRASASTCSKNKTAMWPRSRRSRFLVTLGVRDNGRATREVRLRPSLGPPGEAASPGSCGLSREATASAARHLARRVDRIERPWSRASTVQARRRREPVGTGHPCSASARTTPSRTQQAKLPRQRTQSGALWSCSC